jgi:hypothetical protein
MVRSPQLKGVIAPLAALVAVLTLVCGSAQAQVKPFKVTGGGPAPEGLSVFGDDSPHSATGTATHLGKYSGDGIANVLTFDPLTGAGTFQGFFTFVAANGDKLVCTYGDTENGAQQVGQFQLFDAGEGNVTVVFIAEFNPVPELCTGRFANVIDGSLIMVAVTEPFVPQLDQDGFTPPFNYAWEGDGWLEFKKGK